MRSINELMSLKDRRAYVTGAAGHIGLAACETLMELGAHVAVVDISKQACEKRCDDLNRRGFKGRAVPIAADLSEEKTIRKSVKEAVNKLGGLDILIHSAAFVGTTQFPGWAEEFDQQTLKAWDAALRVNLSAGFILAQEARADLEKSKHGSIIFLSSIYGVVAPDLRLYEGTAMKHPAAYGASKAGLIQLGRYLATVLAPAIRVNSITPGGVWRNQDEKFHKRYKEKTPLKRMATEEDLKGAIAYLASDLSNYVTGSNLIVDGGWTAW